MIGLDTSSTKNRIETRKANGALLYCAFSGIVLLFAAVVIVYPDRFFADDSYFYFQVAWNFARGAGSTFNNIVPTNGYHPLWMLLCAAVFKLLPAKAAAVHGIALLLSLLDALALYGIAVLLHRLDNRLWPLAFLFYIPFCFLSQLGTEGALSGCMLSLLLLTAWNVITKPGSKAAVSFNTTVALAVLSRLDNIFVIGLIWLSVYLASGRGFFNATRRLLLYSAAIPAALWGAYLWTNWRFFHTLEPISGLLKSQSDLNHTLGSNIAHTGAVSLVVILICIAILAIKRRDRFFRFIEVPFTLGVFCHAAYISLRMSSETRWTWYYTSWVLLAGILAARTIGLWAENGKYRRRIVGWTCFAMLLLIWVRLDLFGFMREDPVRVDEFQQATYERAGMHSVLAFDKPGRLAYYSQVRIVPLDGLMGDLNFQHELATEGISEFIARYDIDGFIGPPQPLTALDRMRMCGRVYLASVEFQCSVSRDGAHHVDAALVFARIPLKFAGKILLPADKLVWNKPGEIAVWRLH